MEAYRNSQAEAYSFRGISVYLILPIALTGLVLTWIQVRRFTLIWVDRPTSMSESIIAGLAAWLCLFFLGAWIIGMVLTMLDFLSSHNTTEIWEIIIAVTGTGSGTVFILRSRSELGIDDTIDYMKEAIQFRRSAQTRMDLVALIKLRQKRHVRPVTGNDPETLQRLRLQASLNKEKELDALIAMLKEGTTIDISEMWNRQMKTRSHHPFGEKVEESRIEPNRRRLSFTLNFPEMNEELLKDEMTVLRFNRQVYDFFQSLNSESWLRPFTPFFDSYFLLCRALHVTNHDKEAYYPFLKAGILTADLRKLEGFYFNPRKLSEIATIAFHNGAPV